MIVRQAWGSGLSVLLGVLPLMAGFLLLCAPLALAAPPPNDNFAQALSIEGREAWVPYDNVAGSKETGEPDHRGDQGGASVWFEWTAPRTGGVFLEACSEPQEMLVAAYTGTTVDGLTPVAPLEDRASCLLTFMATAGVSYGIAIDGRWDQSTEMAAMREGTLHLVMVPVNDDFEDAMALTGGPKVLYVGESTIGATEQPGEPEHGGTPGGASVWFSWIAPGSGSVAISACDATFPILAAAYTGSSLSNLALVQARQAPLAEPCGASSGKAFAFNTESGVTYRVAVDGAGGATGRFDLGVEYSNERLPEEPPEPSSGSSPDTTPPNTKIYKRSLRSRKRAVTIAFRSSDPNSTFLCKLDRRKPAPCKSPKTYKHLKKPGRHRFEVWAIAADGDKDPTPAISHFRFPTTRSHHRSHNRHHRKRSSHRVASAQTG